MNNSYDNHSFQNLYRPKLFSEMYGIDHLTKQFETIFKNKRLSTILFSGLNGHGKTTLANIFIRRLFCSSPIGLDACLHCDECLNIDVPEPITDVYHKQGRELTTTECANIEYRSYLIPRTLPKRIIFIDDFDFAENAAIEKLQGILDRMHEYVITVFTVTDIGKIPTSLRQRSKLIPVSKIDYEPLDRLIHSVCGKEDIPIENIDAVQNLITLSEQTPRIILTALEIIKGEEVPLSNESLNLPIVIENLQMLTGKCL